MDGFQNRRARGFATTCCIWSMSAYATVLLGCSALGTGNEDGSVPLGDEVAEFFVVGEFRAVVEGA